MEGVSDPIVEELIAHQREERRCPDAELTGPIPEAPEVTIDDIMDDLRDHYRRIS